MRIRRQTTAVLGVLTGLAGWVSGAHAQTTPPTPPAAPPVVVQTAPAAPATAAPAVTILTEATPALWKVQGVHGTVYLFGSVHVMKKDVHWETGKVKDAFTSSSALYLEIAEVDPASQAAAVPLMMQYGMDAAHPLSTKISKEDVALLDAAAKKMGQPGEQMFEPMQPWLASQALVMLPAMNAGYDGAAGIDMTLDAEALAAKKPVVGFETLEAQLHLLADAPLTEQVEALHNALTDKSNNVDDMNQLVGYWTHGDVEKLAALENSDLSPKLYDRLLVKRNERFADAIAVILKAPQAGTVFVCVGAAHLAGPDSVLKMLETRGFKAVRVE